MHPSSDASDGLHAMHPSANASNVHWDGIKGAINTAKNARTHLWRGGRLRSWPRNPQTAHNVAAKFSTRGRLLQGLALRQSSLGEKIGSDVFRYPHTTTSCLGRHGSGHEDPPYGALGALVTRADRKAHV